MFVWNPELEIILSSTQCKIAYYFDWKKTITMNFFPPGLEPGPLRSVLLCWNTRADTRYILIYIKNFEWVKEKGDSQIKLPQRSEYHMEEILFSTKEEFALLTHPTLVRILEEQASRA